jgi:AbrB family looped-hinge helix DNA binding protein
LTLTTMRDKGQVTLPAEARRAARIEDGTLFEVEVLEDGAIVLHPKKLIPASQAWFWSERWQEMEHEVDEHVARGEVITSNDSDEFFADLDASLK